MLKFSELGFLFIRKTEVPDEIGIVHYFSRSWLAIRLECQSAMAVLGMPEVRKNVMYAHVCGATEI